MLAFCSSATPSRLPPPEPSSLPRHVAVVMDGNRRWARERRLPVEEGHRAMLPVLERTVRLSCAWGVPALTAFAFSLDNLIRPKVRRHVLNCIGLYIPIWASPHPHNCSFLQAQIDNLMALIEGFIRDDVAELSKWAMIFF